MHYFKLNGEIRLDPTFWLLKNRTGNMTSVFIFFAVEPGPGRNRVLGSADKWW